MADNERLLVFGIDGGDWEILDPLLAAGHLPTLAKVVAQGVRGDLASTIHPHSPTAWATFLTGMNPGKHGIFDFLRRRPGSYDMEVVSPRHRGGHAVWKLLSEAGVTCGIVNVPMTYPPERVAGYFVSGLFTSDPVSHVTYPKALNEEMREILHRPYRVDAHLSDLTDHVDGPDDPALGLFRQRLRQVEEERARVSAALMRRYTPRFAVHVVTATDRAQHSFWCDAVAAHQGTTVTPHAGAIDEMYRVADAALAELWAAMGEDATVIVMSDHGGAPLNRVLYLNAWLEQEGYLATDIPAVLSRAGLARRGFRTAFRAAKRLLPKSLRTRLKARVPAARGWAMTYLKPAAVRWSATRAFGEGTFGNICLNVAGREREGVVQPGAEYNALCAEIRAKLAALVDPRTGEHVVERTYVRDELYHGDRAGDAPDIVVVLTRGYQMIGDVLALVHDTAGGDGLFADAAENRFRLSGGHGPMGVLLARGHGIAAETRVDGAQLADLAPTILTRFGVTVPSAMDGRVVPALIGPARRSH